MSDPRVEAAAKALHAEESGDGTFAEVLASDAWVKSLCQEEYRQLAHRALAAADAVDPLRTLMQGHWPEQAAEELAEVEAERDRLRGIIDMLGIMARNEDARTVQAGVIFAATMEQSEEGRFGLAPEEEGKS